MDRHTRTLSRRWLGAVVAGTAAIGLAAYGCSRWTARTQKLARRLEAGRAPDADGPASSTRFDERELAGLPEPVQRYFRTVLKQGQRIVAAATVAMAGTLNLSATRPRWRPFTAQQRIVTRRAGFLWNACVSLLPGMVVRVYDSYVAGEGRLRAAIWGCFKVAELQGRDEIARAELVRFFAEAPWYPTALLPSQGLQWFPVDSRSARATCSDGSLTLSLLFGFDDAGLIESVYSDARGAMVGKALVMTPWEGRWSDYATQGGMLVPHTAKVAWLALAGRKTYFRGHVTAMRHEFFP